MQEEGGGEVAAGSGVLGWLFADVCPSPMKGRFFISAYTMGTDTYKRAILPALLIPSQVPPALASRPERTVPDSWSLWSPPSGVMGPKLWKWASMVGLLRFSSRLVQRMLRGEG